MLREVINEINTTQDAEALDNEEDPNVKLHKEKISEFIEDKYLNNSAILSNSLKKERDENCLKYLKN
jgi:hypothetical protein